MVESNGYVPYSSLPKIDLPRPAAVSDVEPAGPLSNTENTTTAAAQEDVVHQASDASADTPTNNGSTPEIDPPVTAVAKDDGSEGNPSKDEEDPQQSGKDPGSARQIKLLIPEKSFRSIRGSDAIRLSYDDIDLEKILNIVTTPTNVADHFPDWLKQLDGKKIRMRGFMYPAMKAEGLTGFVFTRDTGACCFGPNPYIFLRARVKMTKGETTDYIHMRPFDVEGVFRIEPIADEGELLQLYRIEDARIL